MGKQRILVGIDGSTESREALIWAAQEARFRDATLEVVHAWDAPWNYWSGVAAKPMDVDVEAVQRELVAEELKAADLDGVDLETTITNDIPARAIIDKSDSADLVVVGSRGRGGFTGLLLGSVSEQVVRHSKCPVVVIPCRKAQSESAEEAKKD